MNESGSKTTYVELPTGIFTTDGVWFHTTEALLEEFAGDLLKRVSLDRLLADAFTWLRLPTTLTIWLIPAYLLLAGSLAAVFGGIVTYLFFAVITPFFVFARLVKAVRFLAHPFTQGLMYVAVLSYLASAGAMWPVATGLIAFVLLRWGLVRKALLPVASLFPTPGDALPRADQILRNLIVSNALRYRVDLAELKTMEKRMMDIWHYRRNRDSGSPKK